MIKDSEAIERLEQCVNTEGASPSKRELAETCLKAFDKLLTKDEAASVANFIEEDLLYIIHGDEGIDNFVWLVNIVNAYQKLKEYSGEEE